MILDLIEKNKDITQRELASHLGIAVSMVNLLLDGIEREGYLRRKKHTTKTVEYILTKKGIERRKLLNIWYLKSSRLIYQTATNNILDFLNDLVERGYRNLLLYPAGEVTDLILKVINETPSCKIDVVAVVDDDLSRRHSFLIKTKIISKEDIVDYDHDSILISSYKHHMILLERLLSINYPKTKITQFFE
jgi:DNA-binding MarR family transcriptional regulator